ncbi:UPF0721 transmembrane protein [Azospira sp. I13]|uniref:sulfite exporter TauE/SafE family protein n=1 Tax=Azospira sp. I13 TaxID=1765050 RepID=UPI000D3F546F|nr:sulfite exporter TauE/SafE family protein [Azospira sp. I13]GBG01782.1 UPF0721 transmembrane protein [Azospira sp. I13]
MAWWTEVHGLAILLGGVVGLILAMSGAGGGIIAVPLLVFGLGLPMQQAAPIGLLAVGLAAGLGAFLGWRQGILRYRAAGLIGLVGMATAPLGVWLAHQVPNRPLMAAFALVLVWTALATLRRARQGARGAKGGGGEADCLAAARPGVACRLDPAQGRFLWNLPCARALAGTGLVSGLLSGLLGVGGGFVIVPALGRHSDLPQRSVLATSLGVITLVALGGIGAAAWHGAIPWAAALPFGGGAVAGLLLGQGIGARLAGHRLQQSFALVSLLAAALLLLRASGLLWQG